MSGIKGARPAHGAGYARGRTLLATLLSSAAVAAIALMSPQAAQAQSTWQGTGTPGDYNTSSNWDNSTVPASAGQSAIFGGTGSASVNVSSAVSPDSWTFNSSSRSYTITGSAVTFGGAGIVDSASGQTISIGNNLGGTGGVAVNDATGTLILTGANTYSGTTTINSGATLQIGNDGTSGSLGTGNVANSGTLTFNRSDNVTIANSVSGTGNVTFETGGYTLTGDVAATTITIREGAILVGNGGTTGSVTGNVVAGVTTSIAGINFDRSDDISFGGNISGLGYVAQQGSGTLTLTGSNSYGSTTDIVNGKIAISSDGNLGLGDVRMIGGDGIVYLGSFTSTHNYELGGGSVFDTGANTVTISGTLSTTSLNLGNGQGGITKLGSGTLILTGNNTYTGNTIISAGTLQIGNGSTGGNLSSASNGASITDNGTLAIDHSDTVTIENSISGTGNLAQIGGGTTILLAPGNNFSGGVTISSGTLQIGDSSNNGSMGSGNVTDDAALDFNPFNTVVVSNAISGTGTVTVSNGTAVLSGNNSYSGTTTVSANTELQAGSPTAFSPNSAFSVDGTLDLGGFNNSIASLTDSGAGTGLITNSGTSTATLTISGSSTTTFTGAIQDGSGSVGLHLAGGTLILSPQNSFNNNYSGPTTIDSGATLKAGVSQALSGNSDFTVNGTVDVNGNDQSLGSLSGTGIITNNGGSPATIAIGYTGNSTTFGGIIRNGASALSLSVEGGTLLTLTGNNTYSGTTFICSCSVLAAGSTTAFSPNSAFSVDGTLDLGGFNNSIVSLTDSGGGTGLITNNGTSTATLTISGSSTTTFTGVIEDGFAPIGLHLAGGTLTLTPPSFQNNYRGPTTIDSGATLIGGAFQALSGNSDFTVNGTVDVGGFIQSFGSLSGSGIITNNGGNPATIAIGYTENTTTFGGVIRDGASALSLRVDGGGTLILTGANTYSGTTTINFSTLQIGNGGTTGSLSSAASITDNGTLIFDRSDSPTVANSISGSGGLTQAGSGTLILTGSNSYSGGTAINNGATVELTGTGTLGSGAVTNNGNLIFNRGDLDANIPNNVSGPGSVTFEGGNGYILTGNVAASTITIHEGAILVGDGGTTGSVSGNIVSGVSTSNAGINFDRSDNIAFGGTISGLGYVTQYGTGTLTLTGNNSYGSYTGILQGVLAFASDSNIGMGDVRIYGGTIQFTSNITSAHNYVLGGGAIDTDGNNATITGVLSTMTGANVAGGYGGLTKIGAGTLTLTGTNIYAGPTVISAGTLQIGNGGTTGTLGTGAITDNGTLAFDHSDNLALPAGITGTGGISQLGASTLTIATAQTYGGATGIAAGGTIALNGSGSVASSSGVTDNGIFDISAITAASASIQALSGSGTVNLGTKNLIISGGGGIFGGAFTGTGGLELAGGTTSFTGTPSNPVNVDPGATLQIGNGGTTGAVTGTVTDNGTVAFDRSDTITLPSNITGGGGLAQAGSGTLILTGSTGFGAIAISSGTLQVGNGGTSGDLGNASVTDNGTLAFDRSDSATVGNVISGGGGLVQSGSGTLILTGADTYTGITTISSGTLQIGSGGTSGTLGTGAITDNGTLAFDRSDSVTISNLISGNGGLNQTGSGTLILDGANTFTGTSTVSSGILEIGDAANPGATIGGSANVLSGGTLMGHGTVKGNVTVASGGSLRPGGTIGTLTVGGNLSLPAGSTLTEEVSPSVGDRVNVGGTAALGGNLNVITDTGTYAAGTDYKIISAASVTGTFANVSGLNSSAFAGLSTNLQYSATGVDLILSNPPPVTPPVTTFLFGTYGATPNQIAAGNALTASSSTGALYTAMGALVGSSTASVPAALGQLAGDIRPSLRAAAIEDSRVVRDTVLDHIDHDSDSMTVWGAGLAGYGRLASGGNAANLHHDSAGFLAGIDMPVIPDVMLGADAGYSSNSARTPGRLSAASGDSGHLGAYASFKPGDLRFAIGGDYGFGTVTINRTVPQLGLATTASQDQETGQVFADLGYHFGLDGAALEPHLGVAHIVATGGSFAESGSVAALSGGEKSDSETYSLLGLRANLSDLALDDDLTLTPRFDLGWQHALARLTPYQTVSTVNAATSFLVSGTPLSQDAAALEAGFDLRLAPSATLFVSYDGSFSSSVENNAFHGGLEWKF